MKQGSMTAKQFAEAIGAFPRLSERGRLAARLVLVYGIGQAAVANRLGIHRQQVNRWVRDICPSYVAGGDGWPDGLPPALVQEIDKLAGQVSDGN